MKLELDALGHRNLQQPVAQLFVIAAQDGVAAIDDRHLAAESVENAGKLVGDIAAARDHRALRQFVEVEHLVRGDRMFATRKLGDERPRADRDQDVLGADFLPAGQPARFAAR